MIVRPARHIDVEAGVALVKRFLDTGVQTGLVPDEDTIHYLISDLIDEEDGAAFVAVEDGKVVGGILGRVTPWQFNFEVKVLVEMGWYMLEEYRGTSAGGRLLAMLKRWGKSRGATALVMITTERAESPRVKDFYEGIGLKHIETTFAGRI